MQLNEGSDNSCYVILAFKECLDPSLLHTTVIYMGEYSPEKHQTVVAKLDEALSEGFKEIPVTFDFEEMFGVEKDVRVLRSNQNENFFPQIREALSDLNASMYKDFKPHITTDLPCPQNLTIDRVMFSKSEYEPLKTWLADK